MNAAGCRWSVAGADERRLWDNPRMNPVILTLRQSRFLPVAALLGSALVWGLIWYPYRLLRDAGVGGELATLLTYLVAFLVALPQGLREARALERGGLLFAIALAGAVANLGYVLALLEGRVVVVLLLFYLAPVWTPLLARGLLGERSSAFGLGVLVLALVGAIVMLWRPEAGGFRLGAAEWLGLLAGFAFALCNVLLRRGRAIPMPLRTLALFAGVCVLGALAFILRGGSSGEIGQALAVSWAGLAAMGVVLWLANLVLQFGLARVSANQSIVILLLELPVAAVAAYFFSGETLKSGDVLGGALIVIACVLTARHMSKATPDSAVEEAAR
jgi:drug/metabolite transporter (DMT)-like permease